ncbi:hypothetical protein GCWU000341_01864 [Oribacterium sp. oral taxon 078 str. F0262]|nr:hypothetical protein GCWU000341_01864 [Oribacterium sp. oral taxon 078 str. F0262]
MKRMLCTNISACLFLSVIDTKLEKRAAQASLQNFLRFPGHRSFFYHFDFRMIHCEGKRGIRLQIILQSAHISRLKAARSIFAEGGIWEIRGIGGGPWAIRANPKDHVAVNLVPGA